MASDSDEALLYAQGVLGVLAEQFWSSDVGRYVIQRSLDESRAVIAKLKDIDAFETHKILALQLEWRASEKALIWINEAIQAGKSAVAILENRQETAE